MFLIQRNQDYVHLTLPRPNCRWDSLGGCVKKIAILCSLQFLLAMHSHLIPIINVNERIAAVVEDYLLVLKQHAWCFTIAKHSYYLCPPNVEPGDFSTLSSKSLEDFMNVKSWFS